MSPRFLVCCWVLLLGVLLAGCGSGSGSAGPAGTASGRDAGPPVVPPAEQPLSHFERLPVDAAVAAQAALGRVLATPGDTRSYLAFRRAMSWGEPFFRERATLAEPLYRSAAAGANGSAAAGAMGGALARLDVAIESGDKEAVAKEGGVVVVVLQKLKGSFEKERARQARVPFLLPRAAFALGEIFAGSKPGVASSAAGVVADALGHLDAIEQLVLFNQAFASVSKDHDAMANRVQENLAALRKALRAAETAGELSERARLIVRTGKLGADIRKVLGPSSDLWKPYPPAVSADDATSVLTLPRSEALTPLPEADRALFARADAPIDRFARGDEKALSDDDRKGFDVLAGKARCTRCHAPPLFGALRPPDFKEPIFAVLGVPASAAGKTLDADPGRNAVTHDPADVGAFGVPTLRNVDRTAPYFHNGAFATLESVVDFLDKGGGRGLGLNVPNQNADVRELDLPLADKKALLRFLRVALTAPAKAPG